MLQVKEDQYSVFGLTHAQHKRHTAHFLLLGARPYLALVHACPPTHWATVPGPMHFHQTQYPIKDERLHCLTQNITVCIRRL